MQLLRNPFSIVIVIFHRKGPLVTSLNSVCFCVGQIVKNPQKTISLHQKKRKATHFPRPELQILLGHVIYDQHLVSLHVQITIHVPMKNISCKLNQWTVIVSKHGNMGQFLIAFCKYGFPDFFFVLFLPKSHQCNRSSPHVSFIFLFIQFRVLGTLHINNISVNVPVQPFWQV